MAWSDSVNGDGERRGDHRLEWCLFTTPQDVFRVPWEDVVLLHSGHPSGSSSADAPPVSPNPGGGTAVRLEAEPSGLRDQGEESVGDFMDLTERALPRFSPQKGSLTQSISMRNRAACANRHTPTTGCTAPRTPTLLTFRDSSGQEMDKGETLAPRGLTLACTVANSADRQKWKNDGNRQRMVDVEDVYDKRHLMPLSENTEMRMGDEQGPEEGRDKGRNEGHDMEQRDGGGRDEEQRDDKRRDEGRDKETYGTKRQVMAINDAGKDEERRNNKQDKKQCVMDQGDEEGRDKGRDEELCGVDPQDKEGRDEIPCDDKRRDMEPCDVDRQEAGARDEVPRDEKRHDEEQLDLDQRDEDGRDEELHDEKRLDKEQCDMDREHEEGPYNTRWGEEQRDDTGQDECRYIYKRGDEYGRDDIKAVAKGGASEVQPQSGVERRKGKDEDEERKQLTEGGGDEVATAADSCCRKLRVPNTHTQKSSFETLSVEIHVENLCSEKLPVQIHTEHSYSEKHLSHAVTQPHTCTQDFCCEKPSQLMYMTNFYAENVPQQMHNQDSHSEERTDSDFKRLLDQIQTEDFYSEKVTRPRTYTQDSCCENAKQQMYTLDYCSEKFPEQIHNEDSSSEKPAVQMHTRQSYFEKLSENIHTEDCDFEALEKLPITESHCQTLTPSRAYTQDSCCEKHSQQMYTTGFCLEKFPEQFRTDASDTEQMHSLDCYSEKLPDDTCTTESPCQTLTPSCTYIQGSCCEKRRQQMYTTCSCSEKFPEQIHTGGPYSGKSTEQTHSLDCNTEKLPDETDSHCQTLTTPATRAPNSHSEKPAQEMYIGHAYSEKLPDKIRTTDSYFQTATAPHTCTPDSFTETSAERAHGGQRHFENSPATISVPDEPYCEKPEEGKRTQSSSCERLPKQVDTCSEHNIAEDSYFEDVSTAAHTEDSFCENGVIQVGAESHCEKPSEQLPNTLDCRCKKLPGYKHPYGEKPTEHLQHTENSTRQWLSKTKDGEKTNRSGTEDSNCEREAEHAEASLSLASFCSGFSRTLLRSGVLALPGSRDQSGHPLLTVDAGDTAIWSRPDCCCDELLRLLLYYVSTLSAPALTVLVDARRASPAPALLSALEAAQEKVLGCVDRVLVLVDKDSKSCLHMTPTAQVEVLTSLERLFQHVDVSQLPQDLGGSFRCSHSSWLAFRTRVEQLSSQCQDVINLLQHNISVMEDTPLAETQQDAECQLSFYQELMSTVLGDSRLVRLQQEGGASLSLLRQDEDGPQREAMTTVSCLYERVDELLHRLVAFNNDRTRQLHFLRDFCRATQAFGQVRSWMEGEGQLRLSCLDQSEDSLEALRQKQHDFKDFHSSACARLKEGEAALHLLERWLDAWPSDTEDTYRVRACSWRAELEAFGQHLLTAGRNIHKRITLYSFLDHAYGWAIEGRHRLAAIALKGTMSPEERHASARSLEEHGRRHPPIPEAAFQEMMSLAKQLRDECGVRQLSFARATCREACAMFDKKMADIRLARDYAKRRRSLRLSSFSIETLSRAIDTTDGPPSAPVRPQHTPFLRRLFGGDPTRPRLNLSASFVPLSFLRPLRKTQSFDCPAATALEVCRPGPSVGRALSEPARRGNTGVFIRGLEVSSGEAADRTLCPRSAAPTWAGRVRHGPGPAGNGNPVIEDCADGRKLRHIVEEMVMTEREYVRSLRYVIRHYFPEMERADLPQDLRGKRFVIFGNLEKLLDFHAHFFLKELEACWKHPLRVAHSFLRHREQFSLYALYSKNKPKSDALLASHGLDFFKRKQRELGAKMDLCSYLLKPVQRMSKYALLLEDLIKEAGAGQEAERTSLWSALAIVRFQLRHGNDLLAMDAIRHCDVDLKEQGRLLRQDHFTVWSGRRKCNRRVFLFEELLLLSKAKKMDGGLDVFEYKSSFKTSDLGLTESKGDDGLRFEIWFRRRTSKNQTLILQAANSDIKRTWTRELTAILWSQAARNKEARLKELLSMGVGNKTYLDIQPSAAAISDRAVHHITRIRGAGTRASIAVCASDRADPFRCVAPVSNPASAGLLGSLNLHVFCQQPARAEDEERERDTASQRSIHTDSSGSSSHCLSGSAGSDSGCVSSWPRDLRSASLGSSHNA